MKRILVFLILLSSLLFGVTGNSVYAAGVPMPQYTTSVYATGGGFQYIWSGNSGYYTPKPNYVYWGTVGGANFYSGSVSATWFSQYTNIYNSLMVDGWNGSQWVNLINDTDTSYFSGDHTLNKTYSISGNFTQIRLGLGGNGNATVTATVSAVVADQQTVQAALDAANAANAAAQSTVSYAQNASNQASNASSYSNQALNWLNGTWGGYNLGTVGQNATNAMNNSWDSIHGVSVGTATGWIHNDTWDGSNSVVNYAKSARDNASQTVTNTNTTNGYLTNATYGLNAINNNVSNLQTSVNNMQTSINNIPNLERPDLSKVYGYKNASATSTSTFNVTMNYSGANEYQYRIDNGAWSGWTSLSSFDTNGYLTVSGLSTSGMHTIYIQLRQNGGSGAVSPVANGNMTMFKL